MNAIQNLGIALGSLGGGYLLEATNQDYHMLTFSFGCMAGISCLLTMALFYVDLNS
jgi:predicted MFS family arabinose efflux permease